MTKALAEVKLVFDAPTSELPERSIVKVLEWYRRSGVLDSFLDLKYTCFGVCHRLIEGWCLLDDDQLFSKLLYQVDNLQSEPRRFRKCFQGLLSSYFGYQQFDKTNENWEHLGGYLAYGLPSAQQALPIPNWLMLLEEHKNLLGPNPCERYADELRNGSNDVTVHQVLREGLGVTRESWVWQELVLSQIQEACRLTDQSFKGDLERLLRLIQANNMLSTNLIIRCTAMLVSRYANCVTRPEYPSLREAAVNFIGNPWLKRTAWDAHVKTENGEPHEKARQMINGWIKRELTKNFFELLSDDGSADQRRLNYWLRFEPVVEDMWFALGPHATKLRSPEFKDFRNRARGRLLKLEASGLPQNNAFIMLLGSVTVVEFGSKGNATYVYRSDGLPFDLSRNWINGDGTGLKNQQVGERFFHRDGASSGTTWEEKFDERLCPLIGFTPQQDRVVRRIAMPASQREKSVRQPAPHSLFSIPAWERDVKVICERRNFRIHDARPQGGAFWVLHDWGHCPELDRLGFKYKSGKGWWKE